MEEFSFLEKVEVEDEEKKKYWVYRCKHCQHQHFTIDLSVLEFIQKFEEKK